MNLSKLTADTSSIEETLNSVKGQKPTFEKDERQFRPNLKNDKKEYRATLRFLPQGVEGIKGNNGRPYFVERWDHAFQENGMWYIEKCPSLLNKLNNVKGEYRCPACESNRVDWNSNQEVLKDRARSRKIKKTYPTNILVIDDPQFPENNGKVMYWNMPLEIVKMIEAKWKPQSKNKKPSNPYCPITGYAFDLVLLLPKGEKYPTYSGSDFLDPEQLATTEEEIISILGRTYDLSEFGAEISKYKPYDDLKKRFTKVTSGGIIVDSEMPTVFAEDTRNEVSSITVSRTSASRLAAEEAPSAPIVTEENEDESWIDD